jgi:hypothetical protein
VGLPTAEAVIGAARASSYLSSLSADTNRRKAARRAENSYSGISQSGNLRAETASTRGALWAMKSLHKACLGFDDGQADDALGAWLVTQDMSLWGLLSLSALRVANVEVQHVAFGS